MRYIGEALLINTTLRKLNLCRNSISAKKKTHTLTCRISIIYNLGNRIGPEGAKYIARSFWVNTALIVFNIRCNFWHYRGSYLYILISFYLDNYIYDEGGRPLADSLEHNYSIRHLDMNRKEKQNYIFRSLIICFLRLSERHIHRCQRVDRPKM
jgi:hypothetical protein